MKETLKAMLEIVYFEREDIVTTSIDHDNGFIDGGELASLNDANKKALLTE